MAMQWIKSELRRTDDPRDNERADLITAILVRNWFSDLPASDLTENYCLICI